MAATKRPEAPWWRPVASSVQSWRRAAPASSSCACAWWSAAYPGAVRLAVERPAVEARHIEEVEEREATRGGGADPGLGVRLEFAV